MDSTPPVRVLSISARQKASLLSMLAGNPHPSDPFEQNDPVWKVLIYDGSGRDILAPLLPVSELRSAGVTLHMLLHASRHPIPDVPAVYFIRPTRANLARVAADAAAGLYASLSLNFTLAVPRPELEALASDVSSALIAAHRAADPAAGRISRVYDMYADFHALDDSLFSLAQPDVYAKLNARDISESGVETIVNAMVDGLFCVLVSLGSVPLIRAQRGGPAWMVAERLDARVRETLKSAHGIFADTAGGGPGFTAAPADRPLLVLVDRALDLAVMLHHTWTYQALAHDALGLRLNRVTVPGRDGAANKTFDLDKSDEFWREYAGKPFPVVAEAVESALQGYQSRVAELNRSAGAVGDAGTVELNDGQQGDGTADALSKAVSNIPELAKQKRLIDLHTNIATALLDEIKSRGLDGFFQVEEELLARPTTFDVERVLALLSGPRGSAEDKLRAFLIYYLCVEGAGDAEVSRCLAALREAGVEDLSAYEYLKGVRMFSRSISTTSAAPLTNSGSLGGAYAMSVLDTLSQVASNVNKLILSGEKATVAARDVQMLMDGKTEGEVNERYGVLDPKLPKGSTANVNGRTFKEAIVFVVGPGNYIEFQSCQDHVCSRIVTDGKDKRSVPNGRTLIYGATELCNGGEFMRQLQANGVNRGEAANGKS